VGRESTRKNFSMEITFTAWIVCYPPTIKNIELERIDYFFGFISKILVGLF
jgi:hypothetical protein